MHAASVDDVDRAVRAAKAALKAPSWKKLPATERGRLLVRLSELIEEKKELFASIDAWDNGTHLHTLYPYHHKTLLTHAVM